MFDLGINKALMAATCQNDLRNDILECAMFDVRNAMTALGSPVGADGKLNIAAPRPC